MRNRRRLIRVALLIVGAAVAVVGAFGIHAYLVDEGLDDGLLNVVAGTASLFVPGGFLTGTDLPLTLEVAQVVTPLVAAVTLIELFRTTLEQQYRRRSARWRREHVVLIGLGESGRLIAEQLAQSDTRTVIAIDRAVSPAASAIFDRPRWAVVPGDATDERTLEAAGTHNAALVHVATGQDGVDIDVADTVRKIATKRAVDGAIELKVQIDSSTLCRRLQRDELEKPSTGRVAAEFLNMSALSASAVLEFVTEALSRAAAAPFDRPLSRELRLVGDTPLIRELDDLCSRSHRARMMLNVPTICVLQPNTVSTREIATTDPSVAPPIRSLVIAQYERDGLTIDEAAQLSAGSPQDLVIALSSAGSRPIRREKRSDAGELLIVDPHYLVQVPEILRFGPIELMARLMHLDYSQTEIAKGYGGSESTVPWIDLKETYKRANRMQAFSFGDKLEAIDCELSDVRTDATLFTPNEIEMLAKMEHNRWMEDRIADGWTMAPVRNTEAKQHPDLVPFADLSKEAKDKDRQAVLRLPALAALIGLVVVRTA